VKKRKIGWGQRDREKTREEGRKIERSEKERAEKERERERER